MALVGLGLKDSGARSHARLYLYQHPQVSCFLGFVDGGILPLKGLFCLHFLRCLSICIFLSSPHSSHEGCIITIFRRFSLEEDQFCVGSTALQ
jgi:hypothetical protein